MVTESGGYTLTGIGLFADIGERERSAIEQSCSWRRFAPHQQVIDRNSSSRGVYFVAEGRVRIVNYALSGREITLDELPKGSYFGELSAIDAQPRSARVIALVDSLIAAMPAERFLGILRTHPEIALKVLTQLAKIVRTSNERIMDLSTLGANNRVHAELLRQASENMDGDNRAVIVPNPLHGDIAARVSTTRETVARVMNDLARRKILVRTKDALVIADVKKLRDMVEEVRGE